jgi:hypothetical protein
LITSRKPLKGAEALRLMTVDCKTIASQITKQTELMEAIAALIGVIFFAFVINA